MKFPMWWLKSAGTPVAGIGTEISGGGMQFLLELIHQIPEKVCSIAFQIQDRKIRANIRTIKVAEILYNDRLWQRFNAKFEGLLSSDFEFIFSVVESAPKTQPKTAVQPAPPAKRFAPANAPASAVAGATPRPIRSKSSIGGLDSYQLLPTNVKKQIVKALVDMKRLAPVTDLNLALMAVHYGGIQPSAEGDMPYHRFSVRTKIHLESSAFVFDTHFLVRDDGAHVIVRE